MLDCYLIGQLQGEHTNLGFTEFSAILLSGHVFKDVIH